MPNSSKPDNSAAGVPSLLVTSSSSALNMGFPTIVALFTSGLLPKHQAQLASALHSQPDCKLRTVIVVCGVRITGLNKLHAIFAALLCVVSLPHLNIIVFVFVVIVERENAHLGLLARGDELEVVLDQVFRLVLGLVVLVPAAPVMVMVMLSHGRSAFGIAAHAGVDVQIAVGRHRRPVLLVAGDVSVWRD